MYTRLATNGDLDKIARMASRASGPIAKGKDGSGHLAVVPEHSYTAFMERKAAEVEAEEAKSRPIEPGDQIIGVIAYLRRDGDVPGIMPRLPPLRPDIEKAADEVALQGWIHQSSEWKEDALQVFGKHYYASHLSVAKPYERHGVGSILCRILLADMAKEEKPMVLLMETDYYTMPFYDRFAQYHGLKTSIFGRPYKIPTKRLELFMYFIQIEEAPVQKTPEELEQIEIEQLRNMPGNTIQR